MGKKITADKRDYRKAYVRHKLTSEAINENSRYSKNLLLFYSVECGLKYLLMTKWNIQALKDIERDEEKVDLLGSHNLKMMLKELGQEKLVNFISYLTNHGDSVAIHAYHQALRYGIECAQKEREKEFQMGRDLQKVKEWIEEEMNG